MTAINPYMTLMPPKLRLLVASEPQIAMTPGPERPVISAMTMKTGAAVRPRSREIPIGVWSPFAVGAWASHIVTVMVAYPGLDLHVLLLPAKRGDVEEIVGVQENVEPTLVGGISVEDLIALAQESAEAR